MDAFRESTSDIFYEFSSPIIQADLCVCCLNNNAVKNMVTPHVYMGHQEVYSAMLMSCYSLDILNMTFEFKPLICEECTIRLRDAFQFRNQVVESLKKLEKTAKSEVSDNNIKQEFDINKELDETKNEVKTETEAEDDVIEDDNSLDADLLEPLKTINIRCLKKKCKKKKLRSSLQDDLENPTTKLSLNLKFGCEFFDAGFVPFKYLKKKLYCIICEQLYHDLDVLKSHVINMHSESEIERGVKDMKRRSNCDQFRLKKECVKCTKCGQIIDNFDDLKCHFESCSKKERLPYKLDKNRLDCPECGVLFLNFQTLNVHMNLHYPNFVCETCGKAYASKERLKSHIRNHQSGDYPCKYCGTVFDKITKREHHIAKTHTTGLRYICPKCQEPIKSFYMRQKHLAEVHNQELKRYKCKLCPQSYITPGHLSGHVRRDHLKERNHKCDRCDSAFYTRNALQMHMVKHDGERIHTCEVCQKSYQRYKTLREHMRIHNNDKRFICPVCGRSFTQKCTLKGHLKVHDKKPDLLAR